jgi:hypothetical protein
MIRARMSVLPLSLPGAALALLLPVGAARAHHGEPHPPAFAQADSIQELLRQRARPEVPPGVQAQRRDAEAADAIGDETAAQLLTSARQAVQARRYGQANELVERAESRMLTRSTLPARAGEPLRAGPIRHVAAAREALIARDAPKAVSEIDTALSMLPTPRPARRP